MDFSYRGKYNAKLAEHYRYALLHDLEARVKNDSATAQRTATHLQTALDSFGSGISDEQQLALRAALSTMRTLAADLADLKPWTRAWKKHREEEITHEREARLDAAALKRWGNDDVAMLEEARDLAAFFAPGVEGEEVERHISQHRGTQRVYREMGSRVPLERLNAALKTPGASPAQVRRAVIGVLEELKASAGHVSTHWRDGATWFVGGNDYERWREARAQARKLAAGALATAKTGSF